MARLPFQQATVLPQQNRLSAPNLPNAPGPLDMTAPGGGAQNKALMDLGTTIARIGRSAADIYLTQAEKEKDEQNKIAIVQGGQFYDDQFNGFLTDLEKDPTDSAGAMIRYKSFMTGLRETFQEQYKDKPKRVRNAVQQILDNKNVQVKHLVQMQSIRRQQKADISQRAIKVVQALGEAAQGLDAEFFASTAQQGEQEFRELYAQRTQELINPILEGMPAGLRQEVMLQIDDDSVRHVLGAVQGRQRYLKEAALAGLIQEEDRILRTAPDREQALDDYTEAMNDAADSGVITQPQAANKVVEFGRKYDKAQITALRDSGDIATVGALLEALKNDPEQFPSLPVPDRRIEINRAEKTLLGLQSALAGQVRQGIEFDIGSMLDPAFRELDPNVQTRIRSEDNLEAQLMLLPNAEEQDAYRLLFTYAKNASDHLADVETMNMQEMANTEAILRPERYIEGQQNRVFNDQANLYNQAIKQMSAVQERRIKDPASFYQIPEGQSPFAAATIKEVLNTELEYVGSSIEAVSDKELRRMHINGGVRLFSNETLKALKAEYDSLESGPQVRTFVQQFERQTQKYGPLAFAEAAGKVGDKRRQGIGLPARAMLYAEISSEGTLQNLFDSERNGKVNRENASDIYEGSNLNQVESTTLGNEDISNFLDSLQIDPGGAALANDFKASIVDYVLELGRGPLGVPLGDAVELAADHIVNENYVFLDVNRGDAPVRLRDEQLGGFSSEDMGKALTDWTTQWLSKRKAGMADVAIEDDLWIWKVRGDETGLELVSLNPARGNQIANRSSGEVLDFQELKLITELYVNGETQLQLDEESQAEEEQIISEQPKSPLAEMFREQKADDPAVQPGEEAPEPAPATRAAQPPPEPEPVEEPEPTPEPGPKPVEEPPKESPLVSLYRKRQQEVNQPKSKRSTAKKQAPAPEQDFSKIPAGIAPTDDSALENEITKIYGEAKRRIRNQVEQYIVNKDSVMEPVAIRFLEAQRDMHIDNASNYMRYNDTNKEDRGTYTAGSLPLLAEELAMARVYQELITLHSR